MIAMTHVMSEMTDNFYIMLFDEPGQWCSRYTTLKAFA